MSRELRIAIVGLDTSHTPGFVKELQGPDCIPEMKVEGARVERCMRFPTRYLSEEGQDAYQKQVEMYGVKVTRDFDETVADCDGIMLCINDPVYHLEYVRKCIGLGRPVFLDKPMADSKEIGQAIYRLVIDNGLSLLSSSSLRYDPELLRACEAAPKPEYTATYGPLGVAPAGSSIIWYGVHAFEMLQKAMGRGSRSVTTVRDTAGVVAIVEYDDGRRGVVELTEDAWVYGGCLRTKEQAVSFVSDTMRISPNQLSSVIRFFNGEKPALTLEDTLEVMSMLDAAERSCSSGRAEAV